MSLECGNCERDLRGGHDMRCSRSATRQLIDQVGRLSLTGTIGDGTVAQLQDLAMRARAEVTGEEPADIRSAGPIAQVRAEATVRQRFGMPGRMISNVTGEPAPSGVTAEMAIYIRAIVVDEMRRQGVRTLR